MLGIPGGKFLVIKLRGCLIFCQVSGDVAVPMLVIVTNSPRKGLTNMTTVVVLCRILERLIVRRAWGGGHVPFSITALGEVFRHIS